MKANNTTIESALHLAFSPEYINALSLVALAETWSDNHNARDLELNIAAYAEQCTYKMEQEGATLEFDAWERLTAEIERIARVWVSLYCNEISWSNRPEWIANSVRAALNTTTTPETPNPENNTPSTMNANEINARRVANEFVNTPTHRVNTVDKYGNEMSCPAWGLDMAEAIAADRRAEFPNDTTEIVETGATEYANETTEFSELTHAGQCLDLYLHSTAEIYERYTVPTIKRVTHAIKAGEYVSDKAGQLAKDIQEITPAIQAAARLVKKYDRMAPTAKDIERVTRNYAAYIVDCAKYEIETAAK